MLVSYRLSDAGRDWRVGMLHGQTVIDVSAYGSSAGRISSVKELLPLLDEVGAHWAPSQPGEACRAVKQRRKSEQHV